MRQLAYGVSPFFIVILVFVVGDDWRGLILSLIGGTHDESDEVEHLPKFAQSLIRLTLRPNSPTDDSPARPPIGLMSVSRSSCLVTCLSMCHMNKNEQERQKATGSDNKAIKYLTYPRTVCQ